MSTAILDLILGVHRHGYCIRCAASGRLGVGAVALPFWCRVLFFTNPEWNGKTLLREFTYEEGRGEG